MLADGPPDAKSGTDFSRKDARTVDSKIPGAGEMVGAWALHAGDRIAVPQPGGSVAAVVTAIRDTPDPVRGGGDHELDWTSLDHLRNGHLHYSPQDLVNRLHANRSVA